MGWKVFVVAEGLSFLLYIAIIAHLASPHYRALIASFYGGLLIEPAPVTRALQLLFFLLNFPAVAVAGALAESDRIAQASPPVRFLFEYTAALLFSVVWWAAIAVIVSFVASRLMRKTRLDA